MDDIKTNETKEKLISTALDLFKEQGYEAVTIKQICEFVGISKNTFYYYFKSKEELLLACMGEQKSLSMSDLTSILLSEQNYFEQFWMLQKPRIDFVMSCGSEIMRNIRNIHANQDAGVVSGTNELNKIEATILQKAQESGEIRNSADVQSLVLVGSIQFLGTLALWISMGGKFDFEKVLRSCFECCFDLKTDLRRGEDLYSQLVEGVKRSSKDS